MTEQVPATPGWVDEKLERIFARLPAETLGACNEFAACLARSKQPAQPSDLLGSHFEPCHAVLRRGLLGAGIDPTLIDTVMGDVEALEAEIDADS